MKSSIACKEIKDYTINKEIISTYTPKAGDVAVCKVNKIGKHDSIQGVSGNNIYLFPGDEFLAVFGNRYATEQFEGYVPQQPTIGLQILGKGGVIGTLKSMHYAFKDIGATEIELLGYAVDSENKVINTKYYQKSSIPFDDQQPVPTKIILSLGSSMDSGKTTSAAYLCRGIANAGKQVGYIKLTGTYYTRDSHFARDCGAHAGIDFGLAGFPSTFMCEKKELLDLFQYLVHQILSINPLDYIVMEIADGILQRETSMLLDDETFRSKVSGVFFSSVDSLSAIYGYQLLSSKQLQPFAIGGVFTMSPLLREEVEHGTKVPVMTLDDLLAIDIEKIKLSK